MAIEVKDLPPKYQAQALQKYMAQQARRWPPPSPAADGPPKASKYHNSQTERITPSGAVLHFDSQKEARRYDHLAALERAGQIRDLRLQVDFTLQEAYTDTEGRRVRAIRYRADFTYYRPERNPCDHCLSGTNRGCSGCGYTRPPKEWVGVPWELVVEDVKSRPTRTKEYLLKRKLLKDKLGIDITEV